MDKINLFADNHNLEIIEDFAQAHGAKLKDQFAGTFGIADASVFIQQKFREFRRCRCNNN